MPHYFDTSVVVALLLRDGHSLEATTWLTKSTPTVLVSDFCAIEFAAVVSRRVRTNMLTHDEARRALAEFDDWRSNVVQTVQCVRSHMIDAELLVRNFSTKLSAPDALHLAVARANGLALTTFDERLADAARSQNIAAVIPG